MLSLLQFQIMEEFFKQLNRYYDKIYVLTIEVAEHRRKNFQERFAGLEYEFFFGADKEKFTVEEVLKQGIYSDRLTRHHHRMGRTMRHGEIACSWSHKMIYEDMLANGYNRVMIFEDDAVPDLKMVEKIPEILKDFPENGDLLMWGWSKNGIHHAGTLLKQMVYHVQHTLGKLKWNHTMIRNLHARPYSKHLKKSGFHDFTFAYGLTRRCAEKFLKMQTPIQYVADNLLAYAATNDTINAFITYPPTFLHDEFPDGTPKDSYIRNS
jgi:glycosyl transferase family 25